MNDALLVGETGADCEYVLRGRRAGPQVTAVLLTEKQAASSALAVRDPIRYGYGTLSASASHLAEAWTAGATAALTQEAIFPVWDGIDLAATLDYRLYRELLPSARACARLTRVLDVERPARIVVATSSSLRAGLFSRVLRSRRIAHRVIRTQRDPRREALEHVRPALRMLRDIARAACRRSVANEFPKSSRRVLIPQLGTGTEVRLSKLLAELKRRQWDIAVLQDDSVQTLWGSFQRDVTGNFRGIARLHAFLARFWARTAAMRPVDAPGPPSLLFREWRALVRSMLYEVAMQGSVLSSAIRALRPALLLHRDRAALGTMTHAVGRKLGLRSVWLQVTELPRFDRLQSIRADRLALLGEAYKERFVETGIRAEDMAVVGSDHFLSSTALEPGEARLRVERAFGFREGDRDDRILILACEIRDESLNPRSHQRFVFESVVDALRVLPGVRLIVKLHPLERDDRVWSVPNGCLGPERLAVTRDYALEPLLQAADAVLVQWSTVGLEAMVRGKPVLALHYKEGAPSVTWPSEDAAVLVARPADLPEALRSVLCDGALAARLTQNAHTVMRRYLYRNDGRAWERMADLIDATV